MSDVKLDSLKFHMSEKQVQLWEKIKQVRRDAFKAETAYEKALERVKPYTRTVYPRTFGQ